MSDRYGITLKGFDQHGFRTHDPDVRKRGNELIYHILDGLTETIPEIKKYTIHNTMIYEEYSTIQKTLLLAEKSVKKLVQWMNDSNPKTWKWMVPIIMSYDDKDDMIAYNRGFSSYWLTNTYKDYTAICMTSPSRIISLICPEYFVYGRDDQRQRIRLEDDDVQHGLSTITSGLPYDTPWLDVDDNLMVGRGDSQSIVRHAITAMRAGIEEMPVYLRKGSWTDDERAKLAGGNTSFLWNRME